MVFIFYTLHCFHILGPLLTRERLALPELTNSFREQITPLHVLFILQTNHSRAHTPTTSFKGCQHPGPPSTCPQHFKTRYQTSRDSSYTPDPLKLFKPADSKLLPLPRPFLPTEITIKALAYVFPLFPLPPNQPWCFPVWPCMTCHASSWEL